MKHVSTTLALFLALAGHHANAQGRSAGTISDPPRTVAAPMSETGGRTQSYTDAPPRITSEHVSAGNISQAEPYAGRSNSLPDAGYIAESRNTMHNVEPESGRSYGRSASTGGGYGNIYIGGGGNASAARAPYFSCDRSRDRSMRHCDSVRVFCSPVPNFVAQGPPWFYGPYYYAYYLSDDRRTRLVDDRLEIQRTIEHPTSVLFRTFDGYVVYGHDTLTGMVTMDKKSVFFKPYTYANHSIGNYQLNDPSLLKIGVFYASTSLYFERIPGHDKLMRVIHSGKLSIYDGKFDFLATRNINRSTIVVTTSAETAAVSLSGNSPKQELVDKMNSVYGLSISSQDYNWSQLLSFIDKLN